MVVHIDREIEAALSSLPALLSLKGINKLHLPFLNSGYSVALSKSHYPSTYNVRRIYSRLGIIGAIFILALLALMNFRLI